MSERDWFQVISHNGGLFKETTLELRTTKMPDIAYLDYSYESCLFAQHDSEVLGRYTSLKDAIDGHEKLTRKLGLRKM